MSAAAQADSKAPDAACAPPQSGTSLPVLIACMVLTIGPMIALSQIIGYWRTDVVDDQMFGYYGWRIAHGATVYLDVWDNKPPGIYWINAVGMLVGGGSYLGVIAMCVLALVVAHAAFFVIGTSIYSRSATALATILASFFITHAYYTGGTNRTETFLVACELTAVAFYMRGFARDRWWKWLLAGVFSGGAFLFKQVGLAAWGAMGLHLILLALLRHVPVRCAAARCVLLLGGLCATLGAAAAYLAAQGAFGDALYATFGFNRAYMSVGDTQFPPNYANILLMWDHVELGLLLPVLMAIAGGLHAVLWYWRPEHRPAALDQQLQATRPVCRQYFFLFAVWFAVAFFGAVMSPSRFRHYLVAAIPPLMLMAGYLIHVLRAEQRLLDRFQRHAWVIAAFLAIGYFASRSVQQQFTEVAKVWLPRIDPWLTGSGRAEPAEWEAVGEAVARVTRPGDRIQCFGYMPGVYLQARRINACRFTTTEKVGQVGTGANFIVDEIEAALRADPPGALAISAGDYGWMACGQDPQGRVSQFKLGPWIEAHYQPVDEVRTFNVFVFKRRDLIDPDLDPDLTPQVEFFLSSYLAGSASAQE